MYHYGFVPQQYYPSMFLQQSAYPSFGPGTSATLPYAPMFPPIQTNNFSSGPLTFMVEDQNNFQDSEGSYVEYHHFYGVNPMVSSPPPWYFPQINPFPTYNPYMNYNNQRQNQDIWPEGFTMKGELQWGKLGRVVGPKRELPEFVKDDLRRVYGTYPKTALTITYQNGEFLVKGDPFVGEQEYTIEKKVIRQLPTPDEDDHSVNETQNKKKKKKSKR
ncbi:uncharacterized protein C10orf95 homolog [Microcaecilia unicolor]|uniref:Uncharacterized protein C10orf95 homolog n=1 Tax=Microcaecilia unicolor TaxID=1415580 RepID=A0A6P7YC67_9AMPH|nr:uncharacterized protein C10orf95 homolog [Microcaecilia unicolor]XP_030060636.1 uncharacterized protein C10orf95 homolog [Microcaecilia unicolor]